MISQDDRKVLNKINKQLEKNLKEYPEWVNKPDHDRYYETCITVTKKESLLLKNIIDNYLMTKVLFMNKTYTESFTNTKSRFIPQVFHSYFDAYAFCEHQKEIDPECAGCSGPVYSDFSDDHQSTTSTIILRGGYLYRCVLRVNAM